MRKDILDTKESAIEGRFTNRVNKRDGLAWKFVSMNNPSVPDRIVMLNGWIFFVEFKRPGRYLTEKQSLKHKEIRAQGIHCWMVNTYEQVEFVVDLYMIYPGPFYKCRVEIGG